MPATASPARINRQTGSRVQVTPSVRSFYRGGATVSCLDHGHAHEANTRAAADRIARTPGTFCPTCADLVARGERVRGNRQQRRAARPAAQRMGLDRRYGIEIECIGEYHTVAAALRNEPRLSRWSLKTDPSVRGTSGSGLELVSPPLSGTQGEAETALACQLLTDAGCTVNTTAGLHVHHDMRGVTADQIKQFVTSYVANQDLLDWLVAPSRRNNGQYCQRMSQAELNSFNAARNIEHCGAHSRYRTVNVRSYGRHGTIEFRQHQGTINATKIMTWVKMGQAMIDTVVTSGSVVDRQATIQDFATAIQVDEDSAAYMVGRAIGFGAPVAQVAS